MNTVKLLASFLAAGLLGASCMATTNNLPNALLTGPMDAGGQPINNAGPISSQYFSGNGGGLFNTPNGISSYSRQLVTNQGQAGWQTALGIGSGGGVGGATNAVSVVRSNGINASVNTTNLNFVAGGIVGLTVVSNNGGATATYSLTTNQLQTSANVTPDPVGAGPYWLVAGPDGTNHAVTTFSNTASFSNNVIVGGTLNLTTAGVGLSDGSGVGLKFDAAGNVTFGGAVTVPYTPAGLSGNGSGLTGLSLAGSPSATSIGTVFTNLATPLLLLPNINVLTNANVDATNMANYALVTNSLTFTGGEKVQAHFGNLSLLVPTGETVTADLTTPGDEEAEFAGSAFVATGTALTSGGFSGNGSLLTNTPIYILPGANVTFATNQTATGKTVTIASTGSGGSGGVANTNGLLTNAVVYGNAANPAPPLSVIAGNGALNSAINLGLTNGSGTLAAYFLNNGTGFFPSGQMASVTGSIASGNVPRGTGGAATLIDTLTPWTAVVSNNYLNNFAVTNHAITDTNAQGYSVIQSNSYTQLGANGVPASITDGVFAGNGSGLTNLPPAILPGANTTFVTNQTANGKIVTISSSGAGTTFNNGQFFSANGVTNLTTNQTLGTLQLNGQPGVSNMLTLATTNDSYGRNSGASVSNALVAAVASSGEVNWYFTNAQAYGPMRWVLGRPGGTSLPTLGEIDFEVGPGESSIGAPDNAAFYVSAGNGTVYAESDLLIGGQFHGGLAYASANSLPLSAIANAASFGLPLVSAAAGAPAYATITNANGLANNSPAANEVPGVTSDGKQLAYLSSLNLAGYTASGTQAAGGGFSGNALGLTNLPIHLLPGANVTFTTNLSATGSNVTIAATGGSGSGTVTSVTFTGDGLFDSATPSSAVTSSGTVTATANTQSANTFPGGPTSGSASTPTFRTLNYADLAAGVPAVITNNDANARTIAGNLTVSGITTATTQSNRYSGSLTNIGSSTGIGTNGHAALSILTVTNASIASLNLNAGSSIGGDIEANIGGVNTWGELLSSTAFEIADRAAGTIPFAISAADVSTFSGVLIATLQSNQFSGSLTNPGSATGIDTNGNAALNNINVLGTISGTNANTQGWTITTGTTSGSHTVNGSVNNTNVSSVEAAAGETGWGFLVKSNGLFSAAFDLLGNLNLAGTNRANYAFITNSLMLKGIGGNTAISAAIGNLSLLAAGHVVTSDSTVAGDGQGSFMATNFTGTGQGSTSAFTGNGGGLTNLQGVVTTNGAQPNYEPIFTPGSGVNSITWIPATNASIPTTLVFSNIPPLTFYTNVSGSVQQYSVSVTNQVGTAAGSATFTFAISNANSPGWSNIVLGSGVVIGSIGMPYSNYIAISLNTNAVLAMTNTSSGTGSVAGEVPNTGQIMTIGNATAGGVASLGGNNTFSGNNTFTQSITGNGGGLTNLQAGQLVTGNTTNTTSPGTQIIYTGQAIWGTPTNLISQPFVGFNQTTGTSGQTIFSNAWPWTPGPGSNLVVTVTLPVISENTASGAVCATVGNSVFVFTNAPSVGQGYLVTATITGTTAGVNSATSLTRVANATGWSIAYTPAVSGTKFATAGTISAHQ